MPRRKKLLREYSVNVTEISHDEFDIADREDDLTLTCRCGTIYQSKKKQACRRLNKGATLDCRSCVNTKNREEKE